MPVGAWSTSLLAIAMIACGGDHGRAPTPVERSIEVALSERLGVPVGARCTSTSCGAVTLGGVLIPITLTTAAGEVEWRVDGLLVTTDALEAYVAAEISELGAAQRVTCGRRIRRLVAGDRIACELEHGGRVYATIEADGGFSLETLLDPETVRLRDELVSPELEAELLRASRALEAAGGTGDEAEDGDDSDDGAPAAPDAAR
jgi:hypothetical protein